jgi:ketosteroid isomerase-like protein
MFWRATVCFEKLNGQWLVTHEHSSVPFNMETMQASLDLKP